MLFIAIGESLKNIDKITQGRLLSDYPEIDWVGVKGFRDIIAHHYFDIDAEQVFSLLTASPEGAFLPARPLSHLPLITFPISLPCHILSRVAGWYHSHA